MQDTALLGSTESAVSFEFLLHSDPKEYLMGHHCCIHHQKCAFPQADIFGQCGALAKKKGVFVCVWWGGGIF